MVLTILTALFLTGWLPSIEQEKMLAAESHRVKSALPIVTVASPREAPAIIETILPASIEPLEETTIYPRTSGYLKRWLVDIGDEVEQGQLLAEIDTPEVNEELREAQAALGRLKAKLLAAETNARLAEATAKRIKALSQSKTISDQVVDETLAAAETAASAVESAKADVAAGEAQVERLTVLQSFSKIQAPFAGTITSRTAEVGALVSPGNSASQALFHLEKTDPVRVIVHVPQLYAITVKSGQPAELIVREMPQRKFVGEVTRTARSIDPQTRTMLTEIQVPNEDRSLLTGMYVQVKLRVTRMSAPVVIPAAALIVDADGTRIAVLDDDNRVRFRPVQIDGDYGREIGLANGVSINERIIVNPGNRLREGDLVEVSTPTEKQAVAETAASKKDE